MPSAQLSSLALTHANFAQLVHRLRPDLLPWQVLTRTRTRTPTLTLTLTLPPTLTLSLTFGRSGCASKR